MCYPCSHHLDLNLVIYFSYSNSHDSLSDFQIKYNIPYILDLDINGNLSMNMVLMRPRSGTEHILYVCLSISSRLCCKIMIVSFWVNLNTRPNCVVVQNLYLPSVLQDTTTNYNSGCIVVFCNLPNPDSIVKFKESHRCIIS